MLPTTNEIFSYNSTQVYQEWKYPKSFKGATFLSHTVVPKPSINKISFQLHQTAEYVLWWLSMHSIHRILNTSMIYSFQMFLHTRKRIQLDNCVQVYSTSSDVRAYNLQQPICELTKCVRNTDQDLSAVFSKSPRKIQLTQWDELATDTRSQMTKTVTHYTKVQSIGIMFCSLTALTTLDGCK